MSATNLGLWEQEVNTGKTFYNENWYSMLGYQREDVEFVHDFFLSLLHPDDRHIPDEAYERYLNEDVDSFESEFRLRNKEGNYNWILSIARFVERDEQGNPTHLAGCHLDITEQKNREKKLSETNEKLQQAQTIARLGYWSHDVAKNKSEWTREMFNIWEVDPETFTPSPENFRSTVHPDDLHIFIEDFSSLMLDKKYHDLEFRIITPTGKVKWIFQSVSVICDENGQLVTMDGTAQDITERKEAEQELMKTKKFHELAVNATNLGLWEFDICTGEGYFNENLYRMLGYEKHEVTFSREFLMGLIHPDDVEKHEANMKAHAMEKDKPYETEYRVKAKDGSYRWMLAIARFVEWDKNGNPLKIAGSHLDITERKKLENQIYSLLASEKKARSHLEDMLEETPLGYCIAGRQKPPVQLYKQKIS